MRHLGDITKIDGTNVEPVWCISGGSPCQDLSVAGKRKGLRHADLGDEETTRSGLFMEQCRITKEMRSIERTIKNDDGTVESVRLPRYLIWENVPGSLSSNFDAKSEDGGFGDFGAVLEEIIRVEQPDYILPRLPKKWKWNKAGVIDLDWGGACMANPRCPVLRRCSEKTENMHLHGLQRTHSGRYRCGTGQRCQ